MKKVCIILFTIFFFNSCTQKNTVIDNTIINSKQTGQETEDLGVQQNIVTDSQTLPSIRQQADSLILYYKKLNEGENTQKYERLFFDSFPSSFNEMKAVFGYDDVEGKSPLYDYPLGHDIIKKFSSLTTIPKEEYYQKYISFCIGGKWEADNIQNAFGFADKLLFDTHHSCNSLDKRTDEEIKSVFHFIFDGPHPDNEENQELFNKLHPKVSHFNKRLGNLLLASYYEIKQEDDGHGH